MSYMSELDIEIQEMILAGFAPTVISDVLGIPMEWVSATIQSMDEIDESMDGDFDTAMASAGYGTDEDYGVYEPDF